MSALEDVVVLVGYVAGMVAVFVLMLVANAAYEFHRSFVKVIREISESSAPHNTEPSNG